MYTPGSCSRGLAYRAAAHMTRGERGHDQLFTTELTKRGVQGYYTLYLETEELEPDGSPALLDFFFFVSCDSPNDTSKAEGRFRFDITRQRYPYY